MSIKWLVCGVVLSGALACISACSAAGGSNGGGSAGSGGSGSAGSGSVGSGSGGDTTIGVDLDGSAGDALLSDADICAGDVNEGEQTPLDMLIMLDQSSSMKGARWTAVTTAIKQFVNAPEAAGIQVALNYFALSRPCPNGNECTSWLGSGASGCSAAGFCKYDDYCSAAAYESPEVPFAALPGAAGAIIGSLDAHGPYYDTTSLPALQGAINHAKARATAFPGHKVVVVFATDGLPESHCEDGNTTSDKVSDVAAAAQAGLAGSPSIPTYVIGVGSSLGQLNQVAAAGGTTQAFLVDQSASVQTDFLKAMTDIRGKASLPCEYLIPSPKQGTLDFKKVNVLFTPSGGSAGIIGQVTSLADCGATGGWYYDNPASPTHIEICPTTCSELTSGSGGKVEIQLGCATILK